MKRRTPNGYREMKKSECTARRGAHFGLKKVTAFLLAAALVCSLATVSAVADDTGITETESTETETESTETGTDNAETGTDSTEAGTDSTESTESTGTGSAVTVAVLFSGTSGTCSWQIGADGVLTIAPEDGVSGTLADSAAGSDVPWYNYAGYITSAVIESGVSAGTGAAYLFAGMTGLTSIDGIGGLDVSSCADLSYMFYNCAALTALDLTAWNTAAVTNADYLFSGCAALTALDVSTWDTSALTRMDSAFAECTSLTAIDLNGWDVSNVTTMQKLFCDSSALQTINVSSWNTSKVTDMRWMFRRCSSLAELDVSGWDTSSVTNMNYMFRVCSSLTALDLSGWDTSKIKNMSYIFANCTSLVTLNISGWSTAAVNSMKNMFSNDTALRTVTLGAEFDWVTTDGYLPTPVDTVYGSGVWKDESGNTYSSPSLIPGKTAAVYTAYFPTSVVKISITSCYASLSKTNYVYNGKVRTPSVTLYTSDGKELSSDCYTVTYAAGRTNIGKYKVTIKGTGNYTGTITAYFTIKPARVTISSAKSKAKKRITVKWNSLGGNVRYQVYYRQNGTSTWKKTTLKKNSKILKKLTSGKKYQIKVRAYKQVNGTTYYGNWSKVKTVKVK